MCNDIDKGKIMQKTYYILIILLFFVGLTMAGEKDKGVFGYWKSFNMKTKKPEAIVKIYEKDKKLYGKVVKLLPEKIKELKEMGEYPPLCKKCPGEFKNKPIIGLNFINDLKQDDDIWKDGKILDPETGKIYDVYIYLDKKNQDILKVKGCKFKPLCRTQSWERVSEDNYTSD